MNVKFVILKLLCLKLKEKYEQQVNAINNNYHSLQWHWRLILELRTKQITKKVNCQETIFVSHGRKIFWKTDMGKMNVLVVAPKI